MELDLSLIWGVIIFFGVMMYVLMDGFDLGIGILFLATRDRHDRDAMMNTVAPVWDGNETWLVLGGAGLLAAFPIAYSIVLSALYLPLILMLLGLIFRGVAFEFRFKAPEQDRGIWDAAFIGGSLVATFFQGVALGAFLIGIPLEGHTYAGGPLDWVAFFPLFTGFGLIIAYSLRKRMIRYTRPLALALVAVIGVISLWTPFVVPYVAERWFSLPNFFWFSPVPLLVALTLFMLLRSLRRENDAAPFIYALVLLLLGYIGMAISIWPYAVPPSISIWDAAAPESSQGFALIGTLIIVPLILAYTALAYWVFRGKVKHGEGYH
jgi:cytochrome d ubiquinol oxidase subunit II